jgi:hypothetical protein
MIELLRLIKAGHLLKFRGYLPGGEINCTSTPEKRKGNRMIRQTASRGSWFEVLEDRRLFSAAPIAPVGSSSPPHAPQVSEPKVTTPNLVGTYTGTVTDSNEKKPGTIEAVIETQSASGKVTGYVECTYPGQAAHITQFTGTITGDSFTMTTSTTVVTGTVSNNGKTLTGSYNFNSGSDSSVGHFVVNRTTK